MFDHPGQLMTLAAIKRQEMKAEIDYWRLATAVMQAQQPTGKPQRHQLNTLRTIVNHFFCTWSRPTWAVAVKHG